MERSEAIVLSLGDYGKTIVVERDATFEGDVTLYLIDNERGRVINIYIERKYIRALIEALAQMARLKCTVEE